MILKASQRSGAKQLGAHLLKTEENEHVEIHEVSGFVSDSVQGAMMEAYALARGTKCQQHLFSVSLNPPEGLAVPVETFEAAIRAIEEKNGLVGQPRIVVFHEKEGRRHAHAVWSRIDAETMTAKPLPFFKTKLRDIAKQLYLDNGWKLPKGFFDPALRDPRSFTLDEWQKSKRASIDPREMKAAAQACWKSSDNAASFARALEEKGLFLAQGDRRGFVALTLSGDVFAVSRLLGIKNKDVTARLGDPSKLRTVSETARALSGEMGARIKLHVTEAKRIASNAMKPLIEKREAMKVGHQAERKKLAGQQAERFAKEQKERAARIRGGAKGLWDLMTGKYFRTRKANELETHRSMQRDRAQRQGLIASQMVERSALQTDIKAQRTRHATQVLALYRDAARFREVHESKAAAKTRSVDLER